MQNIRNKHDPVFISRQKSIEFLAADHEHYFQNYRKKYRKSKNINYTNSINSLQTKRSTENILQRKKIINTRKGFSINAIDAINMNTQRPAIIHEFPKRHSEMKGKHFNFRNRSQRLNTISQKDLDYKQKKLKDCIQLMKGVLEQIKNEKFSRKIIKPIINQQSQEKILKQKTIIINKQEPQTKFQKYINNITKFKNDNKILIIKKGKSRSNLSNQNILSTKLLRPDRFEAIKKKNQDSKKQETLVSFNLSNTQNEKQNYRYQQQSRNRLKSQISDIQCSSIAKINQSSFISEFGKKSIMKNILEENQNSLNKQRQVIDSKKSGRMKNSKLLKNIFPNDFF